MKTSSSKFNGCIYFTANALARKTEKLAQGVWKKLDLPPSHAYLLLMVLEEPGLQPGFLSEHLQLQPSTVTRLIEKLEEKKLVVRTAEGKVTNVYPTPKARELWPKMKECVAEFGKLCGNLASCEETQRLVASMARMADKIDS
ncbi:MAG TPA: MarR family transcriptional regulator [Flavisolibacter sp.]|nr:MarR family transcriptional regulator [Flavisolibacter sp.]